MYNKHVNTLPEFNEIINENHSELQDNYHTLRRYNEDHTQFLMDTTMIIHNFNLTFESNYLCPETGILIDLLVPSLNLAIMYADKNDRVTSFESDWTDTKYETVFETKMNY
jgi:hypothetical protein